MIARIIIGLSWLMWIPFATGCLGNNLVDDPFLTKNDMSVGPDNCDGGECPADTAGGTDETRLAADGSLTGGYGLFYSANATWAPGEIESFTEWGHTGWGEARCFECHGVGMPDEPEDHDPRMQYWPWSCARGFPGSSCHGHCPIDVDNDGWPDKPNDSPAFNHDNDPAFDGCTQSGCHDTYDAPKERENHGFTGVPDSFCNSCHDYYWEGWPIK